MRRILTTCCLLIAIHLGLLLVNAHAQFSASGSGPGSIILNNGQTGWQWDGNDLTWDSSRYSGTNTALTRWPISVDVPGFCRLTACFEANISTPPSQNGVFTRTGFTIQLWNETGIGPRVPADLGKVPVYSSGGYRGQTDSDQCWVWEGNMAAGPWQIRTYVHKNRATSPHSQPTGNVRVTQIKLERLN